MGTIYRKFGDISIPEDGHINISDGRVFCFIKNPDKTTGRLYIGVQSTEGRMYPNANFAKRYPDAFSSLCRTKGRYSSELRVGLYAACLGIGYGTGAYPLLGMSFGPVTANAIMDLMMYAVCERSSVSEHFEEKMKDNFLFSDDLLSDSAISRILKDHMESEMIHFFRLEWLRHCATTGSKEIWICVDGTNNDCESKSSRLAEQGHSKSRSGANIVGYMWAVDAETGRPITWTVNRGGLIDCKAFDEIIKLIESVGMSVSGIIIDRGFCCNSVLNEVKKLKYDYIVMLKSSTLGFNEMMRRHSNTIKWNASCFIDENGIFGIADRAKIFAASQEEDLIGLYYDCVNGSARSLAFLQRVTSCLREVRGMISAGHGADVLLPPEFSKYIQLVEDGGRIVDAQLDLPLVQQATEKKGFFAIGSSKTLPVEEILRLYGKRDSAEKDFSMVKTQLDFGTIRVHGDKSIKSRLALAFISAIFRSEIMNTTRKYNISTNKMISKLNDVTICRMGSGNFVPVNNQMDDVKHFLAEWGIEDESFDAFAVEASRGPTAPHGPLRILPETAAMLLEKQLKKKQEAEANKRRPGRPKGVKNKKTLERELREACQPKPEKRPLGRPKGSKNKSTLEKEAREAAEREALAHRRGRPKGRKNNSTLEREAMDAARRAELVPRRGRPKGSKNKPKNEEKITQPE